MYNNLYNNREDSFNNEPTDEELELIERQYLLED